MKLAGPFLVFVIWHPDDDSSEVSRIIHAPAPFLAESEERAKQIARAHWEVADFLTRRGDRYDEARLQVSCLNLCPPTRKEVEAALEEML